ncbi:type II/IV secretion system ATP hydrolase TadA/VirB11/CpaF TadA subfamily [Vibrio variabilis]|uniref:Type II/IV secretion system ATP hydrolase TadA/VirB11/CpaF TadA subfamily n=1 Tax=Vibrio variabilis TaxID=990271 RepID=A0ABQ0JJ68_9VIBR|nr:type II/IV secretion system ATP hydrolase TadA/VirB11/CpaF TadA subfamily [Vibrio variabilis]
MSSNKELYLAFRTQIFEALDAEAVQKMGRKDLEGQIHSAVDLLASNYRRPITAMMKLGSLRA